MTAKYSDEFFDILEKNFNISKSKNLHYHFTSAANFEKIIQSNQLWFSYYKHLNDKEEIDHGVKIFKNFLNGHSHEKYEKLFNDLKLPDNHLLKKYKEFFNYFLKKYYEENGINVYILSLTETHENLALWRLYADDGCGIAIGFENNTLWIKDPEHPIELPPAYPVIYDDKKKEKIFNELMDKVYELCKDNLEDVDEIIKDFCTALICSLPSLKDKSFYQEKEYRRYLLDGPLMSKDGRNLGFHFPIDRQRCIHKANSSSSSACINGNPIIDANYISEKRCIVSTHFNKSAIKEIWIGPQCNFDRAEKEIKHLLQKNEYEGEIKIEMYQSSYGNRFY